MKTKSLNSSCKPLKLRGLKTHPAEISMIAHIEYPLRAAIEQEILLLSSHCLYPDDSVEMSDVTLSRDKSH